MKERREEKMLKVKLMNKIAKVGTDVLSPAKYEVCADLEKEDRKVYDMTYEKLYRVMKDPTRSRKNVGEVCALAYAKTKSIPVFATDERELQPIIDKQLNTGVDDIHCLRIQDIVEQAKLGNLSISRKEARRIWIISGKDKSIFDSLWPNEEK